MDVARWGLVVVLGQGCELAESFGTGIEARGREGNGLEIGLGWYYVLHVDGVVDTVKMMIQ